MADATEKDLYLHIPGSGIASLDLVWRKCASLIQCGIGFDHSHNFSVNRPWFPRRYQRAALQCKPVAFSDLVENRYGDVLLLGVRQVPEWKSRSADRLQETPNASSWPTAAVPPTPANLDCTA